MNTTILLITLALEIGLAAGHGLFRLNRWLEEGRLMYLHFIECMKESA